MTDAIFSVILEQFSSFAADQLRREWNQIAGATQRVNDLAADLGAIKAVLKEAEKRQIGEADIRNWLGRLRAASFDIDAALDEWKTAMIIRSDLKFLHRLFLRRRIAKKIEVLRENLAKISAEKDNYTFALPSGVRGESSELRLPQTTSFDVEACEVRGRDEEKEVLVERLVGERMGIEIVLIVGTGGIGKTALAQLVYGDEKIEKRFECRAWVCVSDPFDGCKIARAIIEALRIPDGEKLLELEALLGCVSEAVKGTRFLLVLDDVWFEDDRKWSQLKNCLKSGGSGSQILVTTRKKEVVAMMGAEDRMIGLDFLSDEVCWSIFQRQAFFGKEKCATLDEIGRRIAGKSKGLPLVAKTLGSLMRFKDYNVEAWERVLKDELWKSKEIENKVFVPFLFSYYDLPSLEKLCLLQCAYFPKDDAIDRDELIQLWVSEGYLNVKQDNKRKGVDCFENLVRRSFLQNVERDEERDIVRCKMHDVVHDFVLFVAKNEWLNVSINSEEVDRMSVVDEKIFHCSFLVESGAEIPTSIYERKTLRALSITNLASKKTSIRWDLLLKLTCLRTLSLEKCEFASVPKRINKLIHLRYLSLQNVGGFVKLPKSLYNLINLHTLKLNGWVYELPRGIEKLVNLRHLYSGGYNPLPKDLGKLTSLETVDRVSVAGGKRTMMLEDLNGMNRLRGSLSIWGIGKIEDVGGAERTRLEDKQGLAALVLQFNFGDRGKQALLLERLKPHHNLKHLGIHMYDGPTACPTWMASLTNLKSLCLKGCLKIESFGPFWKLPSLESLALLFIQKVESLGVDFLGISRKGGDHLSEIISFPKLKILKFSYFPVWEDWEGPSCSVLDIMPRLNSLTFEDCKNLEAPLPEFLCRAPLKTLTIKDCPNLERHFEEGTRKEKRIKILTSPTPECRAV